MSNKRVYEVAKELNMQSKNLISKLQDFGVEVKNHMSIISEDDYNKFKSYIAPGSKKEVSQNIETKKQDNREKTDKNKKNFDNKNRKDYHNNFNNKNKKFNNNGERQDRNFRNKPNNDQDRKNKFSKDKDSNFNNRGPKQPSQRPKKESRDFIEDSELQKKTTTSSKKLKKKDYKNKSEDLKRIDGQAKTKNKVEDKKKFKLRPHQQLNEEDQVEAKTYKKKTRGTKAQYKKKKDDTPNYENMSIEIPDTILLADLASLLKISPVELIKEFMMMGEMYSINDSLPYDVAALFAMEKGVEVTRKKAAEEIQEEIFDFEDKEEDLVPRAPIVTVMGHVDHGKTSLLDAIRNTHVRTGEAGGITQHIGASEIYYQNQKIVFLDTPGHEAFTTLRARGAQVTDIAVLVVAADDGVRPQTIEAIHHAKNAGVPIIVAINKMDTPGANPQKVKQELSQENVIVEDWGGDVISCEVSALKGEGIDQLLESILLQAEILELKANPNRAGVGTIIEANIDKQMGTTATVLLEKGTIRQSDSVFAGSSFGRVRTMKNDKGKLLKKAGPSSAFEITGLNELPQAGEKIYVVDNDQIARANAQKNADAKRAQKIQSTQKITTLENIFEGAEEGSVKQLNVILRADVHGSIEAISASLEKLSHEEVNVNIIKSQVGAITEADILLATTSNAIIFAFNVRPNKNIQSIAEREKVEIRTYRVIYDIINDVKDAIEGLLEPIEKEEVEGFVVVRDIFKVPGVGTIAGGYVQEGKISRSSKVRLIRDDIVIYEGEVSSLKRFKEDAKEVNQGYECGIGLNRYNDIKVDDVIETFIIKKIQRQL